MDKGKVYYDNAKKNKYGFTERQMEIYHWIDHANGTIDEVPFYMDENDIEFYKRYEAELAEHKRRMGPDAIIVHYYNESLD